MGSEFKKYWRKWTFRAWQDTCAVLGLESRGKAVVKIVIAVVGLVVVYKLFGDKPAATEDVVLRAGAFAAILLAFPIVYGWKFIAAPFHLDSERQTVIAGLQSDVSALNEKLTPKFKLSLYNSPEIAVDGKREYEGYYCRLRVEALTGISVKGCRATLTGLEKNYSPTGGGLVVEIPPGMWLDKDPVDVAPNDPQTIGFLACMADDNKLMKWGNWTPTLKGVFDEPGIYKLTMVVTGDGLSKKIVVGVNWGGQWNKIKAYEIPDVA